MVDHNRKAEERYEASRRAATNLLVKLGTRVEQLDRWATEGFSDHRYITEVRLRIRYDAQGEVLAVVKADGDDGKIITFSSADTVSEALASVVNRIGNGTARWHEDRPYGEVNGNK